MRAVFIFVVLIALLALAVPATFAVQLWLDGQATIARSGLRTAPAGRLSTAEYTIAMNEFRDTWRMQATPCRTMALLWSDLTTESAPSAMPVSHKLAGAMMGERRGMSVRWQMRRFVVSCQLEQRFTDRQMLRAWLDRAGFGGQTIGIENAALEIFDKPSDALNRAESARLAALLRAPGLRTQPERWAERAAAIEARVNVGR